MATIREQTGAEPVKSRALVLAEQPHPDTPDDLNDIGKMAWTHAKAGWPVLLVWGTSEKGGCACGGNGECHSPGKHPVTYPWACPNGLKSASSNPQVVAGWYRRMQRDGKPANVAVVPPVGYAALDIDVLEDSTIEFLAVNLSQAPLQETGRPEGGLTYFVRGVEGMSDKWDLGEVKGNGGGYVVVAPSRHISGRFYRTLRGGEVPLAPESVVPRLQKASGETKDGVSGQKPFITVEQSADWASKYADGVTKGSRYAAVLAGAGHFRYRLGPEATKEAVYDLVRTRLQPLWRPAWSEDEFKRRFDRIWRYDEANPRRYDSFRERVEAETTPDVVVSEVFDFGTMQDPGPMPMLVPNLVPEGKLVVLASEPGLGKSVLRTELAVRMALGAGSFVDYYPVEAACKVLILDYENGPSLEYHRTRRVMEHLGLEMSALTGRLLLLPSPMLDLSKPAGQKAFIRQVAQDEPGMVIIDSAGLAIHQEEWGPKFREVIAWLKHVCSSSGLTVLMVGHTVKAARDRSGRRVVDDKDLVDITGNWGNFSDVTMVLSPTANDITRARLLVQKRVTPASLVLEKSGGLWKVVKALSGPYTDVTMRVKTPPVGKTKSGPRNETMVRVLMALADGVSRQTYESVGDFASKSNIANAIKRLREEQLVAGPPWRLTEAGIDVADDLVSDPSLGL